MGLLPHANPDAPNAVPAVADSLSAAIGGAHLQYSRMINFREG